MIISKEKIICKLVSTYHIHQILQILICRVAYLPKDVNIIRYVKIFDIQPAVMATFALSDLMALLDGLY